MSMTEHARRELELLGEEPDVIDWYVKVVEAFASYGHSGGSASVAIPTLGALLRQEALTPLTAATTEWQNRTVECGGEPMWQNRRDSRAFSTDGGRTFYYVDDDAKTIHTAAVAGGDDPEPACPAIGFDRCALAAGHDSDHLPAGSAPAAEEAQTRG